MTPRSSLQLPGYEIIGRVGRGAGAVICEAVEKTTGLRVAIKHIVRHSAKDERFILQAENEYEVAQRFEHPYLRRCLDIYRIRKWLKTQELFLIMEFADGRPLSDECPDGLDEQITIFIRVAQGLRALHGYGFAHADIKPNNILRTADGGLKIIDFGQSCPLGHIKERVQGTPDYMAPEQIHRKKIDHRTDVFNLGATMYWVLTGKYFHTMISTATAGEKKIEIDARRRNDPPHELNPRVPVALSKLVMDCCETDRELRPADMRDLIARLEVVQHVLGRRSAAAPHAARRGGRR